MWPELYESGISNIIILFRNRNTNTQRKRLQRVENDTNREQGRGEKGQGRKVNIFRNKIVISFLLIN